MLIFVHALTCVSESEMLKTAPQSQLLVRVDLIYCLSFPNLVWNQLINIWITWGNHANHMGSNWLHVLQTPRHSTTPYNSNQPDFIWQIKMSVITFQTHHEGLHKFKMSQPSLCNWIANQPEMEFVLLSTNNDIYIYTFSVALSSLTAIQSCSNLAHLL